MWGCGHTILHWIAMHLPSRQALWPLGGWWPVHWAAAWGQGWLVNLLLRCGAQPHSKTSTGATPLMLATLKRHVGVVHTLLQCIDGKGLEERDEGGDTVLHYATAGGHDGAVSMLLRSGAQANIKGQGGTTPLMLASEVGKVAVVEILLQHVGDQGLEERNEKGWTALHNAAFAGRAKVVSMLLAKGAECNSKDEGGRTPLMMACAGGNVGTVNIFLEHTEGQGLEERCAIGWTAFGYAVALGHEELMSVLLTKGVEANREHQIVACKAGSMAALEFLLQRMGRQGLEDTDEDGFTLIDHAAARGHEKVVAALLSYGADANSKSESGWTPLMSACAEGHVGVVKTLLPFMGETGLEARVVGHGLTATALYLAIGRGHAEVVATLLSAGAQTTMLLDGKTPLMLACKLGHASIVRTLLQHVGKQKLEERCEWGYTALHYAAMEGREEVVALLLRNGSEASSKVEGMTPLVLACNKGHTDVAKLLLQHVGWQGLEERDGKGATALHHAAVEGREEVVALLLRNGAQASSKVNGKTPLLLACQAGHIDVAKLLLQHVGAKGLEEPIESLGSTVLHVAAHAGHAGVAALLLSEGAQASSKDGTGATPLMTACAMGRMGVTEVLLQHVGTQGLEERDGKGATALHHAARCGHQDVVTLLLSEGALADSKDQDGKTLFVAACEAGHIDVARVLLQHVGVQGLEDTNDVGYTVLHSAASTGHAEVVGLLLGHGAQVNSKAQGGTTSLMLASAFGRVAVVEMLLQHVRGQGLQETDDNGWTAVHHAAAKGHEEVVTLLLRAGANASSKDIVGCTPLTYAARHGHAGTIQRLGVYMEGQGLEEKDASGLAALYEAACYGHEDAVAVLLGMGAEANSKGQDGARPLMCACLKGHVRGADATTAHGGARSRRDASVRADCTAFCCSCGA